MFFFPTECEILPRYSCCSEQSKRERWESNCAGHRDWHRTPVHDGSFSWGRFLLCHWGEHLLGVARIQHVLCDALILRLVCYLCYFCSEWNRNALQSYTVKVFGILQWLFQCWLFWFHGHSVLSTCKSLEASVDVCIHIFIFTKEWACLT